MMPLCHVVVVVLLLLCEVIHLEAKEKIKQEATESELFVMCDINSDMQISKSELTKCAKFPKSKGDIAKEIFRVFDKNHDGFLSRAEYHEFVAMAFEEGSGSEVEEEEVEVIDREGKKKVMKKKDFDRVNQDKMKGLSMEDGEMTKVEEGEISVAAAKEENPELARVLALGRWIQQQLATAHPSSSAAAPGGGGKALALGSLVNLKTLDSREEGAGEQRNLNTNQDFQLKFEVKIRATAKKKSEVKTFEVWVERNKALYVKPHLAITRLWQQQGAKRVELPPPPPELRSTLIRIYLGPFIRTYGTPLLLVLLGTVLLLTLQVCRGLRSGIREKFRRKDE